MYTGRSVLEPLSVSLSHSENIQRYFVEIKKLCLRYKSLYLCKPDVFELCYCTQSKFKIPEVRASGCKYIREISVKEGLRPLNISLEFLIAFYDLTYKMSEQFPLEAVQILSMSLYSIVPPYGLHRLGQKKKSDLHKKQP